MGRSGFQPVRNMFIVEYFLLCHKWALNLLLYMWQSRVEIKHYSVAYLDHCVRSALAQNFHYRQGSYALGKLMNTYHIYTVHMSLALNGSSALEHFECSNVIEIRNGKMFNFYPGLPHMVFNFCPYISTVPKKSTMALLQASSSLSFVAGVHRT